VGDAAYHEMLAEEEKRKKLGIENEPRSRSNLVFTGRFFAAGELSLWCACCIFSPQSIRHSGLAADLIGTRTVFAPQDWLITRRRGQLRAASACTRSRARATTSSPSPGSRAPTPPRIRQRQGPRTRPTRPRNGIQRTNRVFRCSVSANATANRTDGLSVEQCSYNVFAVRACYL
jgi:hypothetical protein